MVDLNLRRINNNENNKSMVIKVTDEKLLVKRKEFDKLRSEFFANILFSSEVGRYFSPNLGSPFIYRDSEAVSL